MADNPTAFAAENGGFKEAVCIDAGRVFDSCCDRDCLEDLRCFFPPESNNLVSQAINAKLTQAQVLTVLIDVDSVSFHRGFYSCDLTFFFLLTLDLTMAPHTCPTAVQGIAFFNKKVILFGSDGNVKSFSGTMNRDCEACDPIATESSNAPRCVVQCVDPVVLSSRIGTVCDSYEVPAFLPQSVSNYFEAPLVTDLSVGRPAIFVTLGLFTIVQLIRNVQMLIPVYDYCIPEKQCDNTTDQPCDVFRKIKFPTEDFFPTRPNDPTSGGCGCGGVTE